MYNPVSVGLDKTPVTQHSFGTFQFYLKRDDLLHPWFTGNKARKFQSLLADPMPDINRLVGHGSVQANSLYSLAALARMKDLPLDFYVHRIPDWLKEAPSGNYKAALELKANILELPAEDPEAFLEAQARIPGTLFVPEGGRDAIAEPGLEQLAREILEWKEQQGFEQLYLALPSGTGTTAVFLARHLNGHNIEILTCACVGGERYLQQQFNQLSRGPYPRILNLGKKHHFGKLYREDYEIWQQVCAETKVIFELLYDPMMWQCLQMHFPDGPDKPLLYLHQGGLLGNDSLLPRYQRKYPGL